VLIAAAIATLGISASFGLDQNRDAKPGETAEKIRVRADTLLVDIEKNTAQFEGNVVVTQNESKLSADQVVIRYSTSPQSRASVQPGPEAIDRVIASGNVRIRVNDLTAETPMAMYTTQSTELVLEGTGTRIIRGDYSIAGAKIRINRNQENLRVEGKGSDRVTARLVPRRADSNR
jgi:lipopolysaccharide export system protein LptA